MVVRCRGSRRHGNAIWMQVQCLSMLVIGMHLGHELLEQVTLLEPTERVRCHQVEDLLHARVEQMRRKLDDRKHKQIPKLLIDD